jgi:quercetin dioxygenase-like cupin family protein
MYVERGRVYDRMSRRTYSTGDCACFPPGTAHELEFLEDSYYVLTYRLISGAQPQAQTGTQQ